MASHRVQLIGGGVAIASVFLTAACSGGGIGSLTGNETPAKVAITPASGGQDVKPDSPIQVSVTSGKLEQVTVQSGNPSSSPTSSTPNPSGTATPSSPPEAAPGSVTGDLSPDGKSWQSKGYLTPDAAYTVTVRAKGTSGKVSTVTSTFHTLKPAHPLLIKDVTPDVKGEKVGIGIPIIVTFNHAVKDKAAVEKMLTVTAEKPAEGAWRWIGSDQVIYRTRDYWQPHQTVTFDAKLTGVPAGAGTYGMKDITRTIEIGSAQISTVDVPGSTMTVTRDGVKLRSFTISAGNGDTREYTTTSGIHLAMEKDNPVTMESPGRSPGDPGYYKLQENWAVRISNSGEYTHESDPYSPSHGCIHLATSNASWFFNLTQRGDIVNVTGTDRKLAWDNGWGMWQMPFDQWKQGSALESQAQS